jgi:catechol 2,3-dioxygenase-like lactoylglutathione lyase family enzyme
MIGKPTEVMYIVEDLDEAIAFYTGRLGVALKKKEDWGFALLELVDGLDLGLMAKTCFGSDFGVDTDRIGPRLSIRVADLDAEVEKLKSSGVPMGRVSGKKGECRAVNFYDQDGNAIFLWEDPSTGA